MHLVAGISAACTAERCAHDSAVSVVGWTRQAGLRRVDLLSGLVCFEAVGRILLSGFGPQWLLLHLGRVACHLLLGVGGDAGSRLLLARAEVVVLCCGPDLADALAMQMLVL